METNANSNNSKAEFLFFSENFLEYLRELTNNKNIIGLEKRNQ